MVKVEVENLKPITGAGNLRAFVDLNLGGIIKITDARIIQQPDQKPWVAMPSRAYESNGQRKWAQIVELLDPTLKEEVSRVVLAEFAKVAQAQQSAPVGW